MTIIADLITEALALARGPDLSTPAFYYFKQAVRDIAKNQMAPVMPWKVEVDIAITTGAAYATLPTDFCRPISARIDGETTPLPSRHPAKFYQDGWPESNTGTPTECAFEDDRVMFNGTYDEAKDLVLVYQKYPATAAATTEQSPLAAKWDDVLVARMVHLIFLDQRDEMNQKWEEIYAQRLGELLNLGNLPQMASTFKKTMVLTR